MSLPTSYLDQLPGCFGKSDHVFAGSPESKLQARALLSDLLKSDYALNDLVTEMENYLKSLSLSRYHITTQSLKAKNLETYW